MKTLDKLITIFVLAFCVFVLIQVFKIHLLFNNPFVNDLPSRSQKTNEPEELNLESEQVKPDVSKERNLHKEQLKEFENN